MPVTRPTLTIKNVTFGTGMPKICLPEVERSYEDIVGTVVAYEQLRDWQVLEVRLDFYEDLKDDTKVKELLKAIRAATTRLVLVTIRTSEEGGTLYVEPKDYLKAITAICDSGGCDLIDIELSKGDELVTQCVNLAHIHGLKVILSKHDFEKTPSVEEMEDILKHMDRLDGDIYKLAVMPQDKFDVMNLLKVTDEMSTQLPKPLITMAMSELGEITRVSGEAYGSVMTFANAGKVSAPGQIPLTRMIKSLKDLHESQGEDHD